MADLAALAKSKDELIDVPLIFDPDSGEPTDGFRIAGANSERYQEKERELQKQGLRRTANRGRGLDARTDSGAEELARQIAKGDLELAKAIVVEVYGLTVDGQPVDPTDTKALDAIFKARPTWVQRVLTEAKTERGFTRP